MNKENILNVEVSCFDNYRSIEPQNVNLLEFLTDDRFIEQVNHIRSIEDKSERNKLKSNLPCITPSGIFTKRNEKELIQYSRLMCIDIDGADNPDIDMNELKKELSHIENVAFCAFSVSGKGVFCLIPIKYTDKHKQHFEALRRDFMYYGIIIDKSCCDVARLRGYSYDPNPYINLEAIQYIKIQQKQQSVVPSRGTDKNDRLEQLISKIEARNIDICPSYEEWFAVGCALASYFGENGRSFFHVISCKSEKYNPNECDIQYTNCLKSNKNGYKENTIFEFSKRYGITLK